MDQTGELSVIPHLTALRHSNPYLAFAQRVNFLSAAPRYARGFIRQRYREKRQRLRGGACGPTVLLTKDVGNWAQRRLCSHQLRFDHRVARRDRAIDFFSHAHAIVRDCATGNREVNCRNGVVMAATALVCQTGGDRHLGTKMLKAARGLEDDVEMQD